MSWRALSSSGCIPYSSSSLPTASSMWTGSQSIMGTSSWAKEDYSITWTLVSKRVSTHRSPLEKLWCLRVVITHCWTNVQCKVISRKKLLRHSLREKTHLGYPEQRMLVNDRLIRSENDADDRLVALQVIGTETLLYAYGARPGSIVASSERGLEQGQYMKLGDFSIRRGFDPATYTVTGIIKNFKGYNYGAHAKHETVVLTPAQNFINIVCDPVMIVAYFFARGALNIKDLNELIFGVGEITIRESAKDEPLYCKLRPIGGDRVTLMPTTPAGAGAISEQLREACRRVLNKTATVYAYRREVANHLQMVLGSELAAVVMSHVDVGQRDVLHRSYSSRTANLDLMAYANREGEVSASALTRDRMMESIRPAVLHLAANPDALQVPISRHQRTWEDDHIDSTEDPANSIEARNLVRSVDNVKVGQRKTIIAKDEEDETKNDPRYISALRLAEEAFVKFLEAHGDYTPAPDAKGRKTPAEFLKVSGNISKIEKSFDSSAFSVEKKEKIAKLKQEAKNAFDNLRRLHDNLRDQIRRDRQLAKLSEQTSTTIYEQERAKQVLAGPMPVLKGVMQPPGKRAPRPSDGTDLSHILPNSAISNTAHILPSSTTSRIAPPSSTPVTASSDPTILSSIQRATQSAQDHGTNDGLTSIGDEINDSDAAGLDGDVESPSDDIDVDELQSELRSTDAGRRGEAIRKAKGGFESFMVRHLTQKGAKNQIPDTVTPLSTISEEPTRAKARPQEGLVPGLRGDKENTMMPELPAAPLKIAVGDKTFKVSIAAWTGRVHLLRYLLDPVNKDRSSGAPQVDVDPRPQKQGGGYYCKRDDCALEVTNGRTGTRHEDIVKLVGHLNTIHSAFALKEKEWRKSGPMNCPVCKLGPFADAKEMRKHALRNCDAQLWWFYLRPPRLRDATKDHMGGWSWGKIATMSEPGRKLVLDITALNIPSRHHKHFEAMAEGLPARVPVPSPYDDHEWVELVPVESAPPDF
ncbi:hypothetical protein DL93DRAFT_156144 [Clavulina sp. PMI_390]|nr:hypothetical protein DL93DRAFT_156144 [Clavulina sp. PMI_390]